MTDSDYIATEKRYRIEERLGILCGASKPTAAQMNIARSEADDWEEAERLRLWSEKQENASCRE
jgi:hypothetical protein